MGTDLTHLTTLTPVSFLWERLLQKIAARQNYNASRCVEIENRIFREINQDFILRQNRTALVHVERRSDAESLPLTMHMPQSQRRCLPFYVYGIMLRAGSTLYLVLSFLPIHQIVCDALQV